MLELGFKPRKQWVFVVKNCTFFLFFFFSVVIISSKPVSRLLCNYELWFDALKIWRDSHPFFSIALKSWGTILSDSFCQFFFHSFRHYNFSRPKSRFNVVIKSQNLRYVLIHFRYCLVLRPDVVFINEALEIILSIVLLRSDLAMNFCLPFESYRSGYELILTVVTVLVQIKWIIFHYPIKMVMDAWKFRVTDK